MFTPGSTISPCPFSPFVVPPGVESNVYTNHVVDALAAAFTLGDGAKHLIRKSLRTCYEQSNAASIETLIDALESTEAKGRIGNWKVTAQRALESLVPLVDASATQKTQADFTQSLLQQNTIIELDSLDQSLKMFLVPILSFWIYSARLAAPERETLKFIIVVEEAHNVLYRQDHRSNESLMGMLLRQGRELGLCFMVIDQQPHLLSSAALGNCYTTICLNQKDPTDINKAASLSLLDESQKPWLSRLPVGEGIVKLQDRWTQPFLVRFPLVQLNKGMVTNELLKQFVNGKISHKTLRTRTGADSLISQRVRQDAFCVDEHTFALLRDVLLHPDDAVRNRYKRLGFSVDRGHRYKEQLLHHRLLGQESIKVGKTYKTTLHLADKATPLLIGSLDPNSMKITNASLVHEFWKHHHARVYAKQSYQVEIERERNKGDPAQGRVDICAHKNGPNTPERVAIEIETGKSDVIGNVQRNLLAGMTKVVVVATDERAMTKVELALAHEGLLIPGRVALVMASCESL